MRELKFRAWDKVEKKMLFDADPFALHVSGSNEPLLAKMHRNEDCIFEQYIGLNDKNGKEIYEGDIVKIVKAKRFNENMELVNCRRKNEGNYVVLYDELNGEYVFCESKDTDSAGISGFPYWAEYCVIGNIHEYPELLEKE